MGLVILAGGVVVAGQLLAPQWLADGEIAIPGSPCGYGQTKQMDLVSHDGRLYLGYLCESGHTTLFRLEHEPVGIATGALPLPPRR